ncbi:unnamed protein product [Soboliphyme baturini]|uniref:B3_4 domain-containing protein n=1 Tax=Soboliphyme baturini TaxID=241478 RepID=A0A183ILG9_9BILA|nr:unnamed protein product [Soboliphyme baturini]
MDEENDTCAAVEEAFSRGKHELKISGTSLDKWLTPSGCVPSRLFELSSLNFLELSKSNLRILPPAVSKLSNLTSLMLYSNHLECLPSSVGELKKLKFLNVANNSLSSLPDSLHECLELQSLIAFHNRLSVIPDTFTSLVLLNDVNLAVNCLTEFPRAFCTVKMQRLLTLDMSDNQITKIPDGVVNLTNLRMLDLSNNKVPSVPQSLANCSKLKELKLNDNCLSDKRLEKLVKSGVQKAILQYIVCKQDGEKITHEIADPSKPVVSFNIVVLPHSHLNIRFDSMVVQIRPYLLCCIIHSVDLSEPADLRKFIKIQSKLHDEECKKRTAGTIATHDLASIRSPLLYTCRNPVDIMIHPLSSSKPVIATELMKQLTAEAEALKKEKKRSVYSGIHQYLYLLKDKSEYPCLVDADDNVISLPPLTNSSLTKISSSTTDVLVEVSSSENFVACNQKDEISGVTSMQIEQVKILQDDGSVRATFPSKNDLKFDNVTVNRELLK